MAPRKVPPPRFKNRNEPNPSSSRRTSFKHKKRNFPMTPRRQEEGPQRFVYHRRPNQPKFATAPKQRKWRPPQYQYQNEQLPSGRLMVRRKHYAKSPKYEGGRPPRFKNRNQQHHTSSHRPVFNHAMKTKRGERPPRHHPKYRYSPPRGRNQKPRPKKWNEAKHKPRTHCGQQRPIKLPLRSQSVPPRCGLGRKYNNEFQKMLNMTMIKDYCKSENGDVSPLGTYSPSPLVVKVNPQHETHSQIAENQTDAATGFMDRHSNNHGKQKFFKKNNKMKRETITNKTTKRTIEEKLKEKQNRFQDEQSDARGYRLYRYKSLYRNEKTDSQTPPPPPTAKKPPSQASNVRKERAIKKHTTTVCCGKNQGRSYFVPDDWIHPCDPRVKLRNAPMAKTKPTVLMMPKWNDVLTPQCPTVEKYKARFLRRSSITYGDYMNANKLRQNQQPLSSSRPPPSSKPRPQPSPATSSSSLSSLPTSRKKLKKSAKQIKAMKSGLRKIFKKLDAVTPVSDEIKMNLALGPKLSTVPIYDEQKRKDFSVDYKIPLIVRPLPSTNEYFTKYFSQPMNYKVIEAASAVKPYLTPVNSSDEDCIIEKEEQTEEASSSKKKTVVLKDSTIITEKEKKEFLAKYFLDWRRPRCLSDEIESMSFSVRSTSTSSVSKKYQSTHSGKSREILPYKTEVANTLALSCRIQSTSKVKTRSQLKMQKEKKSSSFLHSKTKTQRVLDELKRESSLSSSSILKKRPPKSKYLLSGKTEDVYDGTKLQTESSKTSSSYLPSKTQRVLDELKRDSSSSSSSILNKRPPKAKFLLPSKTRDVVDGSKLKRNSSWLRKSEFPLSSKTENVVDGGSKLKRRSSSLPKSEFFHPYESEGMFGGTKKKKKEVLSPSQIETKFYNIMSRGPSDQYLTDNKVLPDYDFENSFTPDRYQSSVQLFKNPEPSSFLSSIDSELSVTQPTQHRNSRQMQKEKSKKTSKRRQKLRRKMGDLENKSSKRRLKIKKQKQAEALKRRCQRESRTPSPMKVASNSKLMEPSKILRKTSPPESIFKELQRLTSRRTARKVLGIINNVGAQVAEPSAVQILSESRNQEPKAPTCSKNTQTQDVHQMTDINKKKLSPSQINMFRNPSPPSLISSIYEEVPITQSSLKKHHRKEKTAKLSRRDKFKLKKKHLKKQKSKKVQAKLFNPFSQNESRMLAPQKMVPNFKLTDAELRTFSLTPPMHKGIPFYQEFNDQENIYKFQDPPVPDECRYFEKHQSHSYQNSKYSSKRDYERDRSSYRDRDISPGGGGGGSSLNNGNSYRSQSPDIDSPSSRGGGGGGGGGHGSHDIRDRGDHRGGGRGGSGERYSYIQKMRDRDRDIYKKDKYSDKRDRRGGGGGGGGNDRDSESYRTNHDRERRGPGSGGGGGSGPKLCSSRDNDKRSGSDDRDRDRDRDLRDIRDKRDRISDRDRDLYKKDKYSDKRERGGGGGDRGERVARYGDWSEHVSSSGKMYYYNCKTEVSQWEKPKEWLDRERNLPRDQHREKDYRDKDRDRDRDDRFSRSSAYTKHSNARDNSRLRWNYENDGGPPIHRRRMDGRHNDNADMDISGDSTPTSEASYSLTGTPNAHGPQMNDQNIVVMPPGTMPCAIVNALPRLASHPNPMPSVVASVSGLMHFPASSSSSIVSGAGGNGGNAGMPLSGVTTMLPTTGLASVPSSNIGGATMGTMPLTVGGLRNNNVLGPHMGSTTNAAVTNQVGSEHHHLNSNATGLLSSKGKDSTDYLLGGSQKSSSLIMRHHNSVAHSSGVAGATDPTHHMLISGVPTDAPNHVYNSVNALGLRDNPINSPLYNMTHQQHHNLSPSLNYTKSPIPTIVGHANNVNTASLGNATNSSAYSCNPPFGLKTIDGIGGSISSGSVCSIATSSGIGTVSGISVITSMGSNSMCSSNSLANVACGVSLGGSSSSSGMPCEGPPTPTQELDINSSSVAIGTLMDQQLQQRKLDGTASSSLMSTLQSCVGSSVQSGNLRGPEISPKLAKFFRPDLITHVTNWQAESLERQAQKCSDDSHGYGDLTCARICAELKCARSVVRSTEINATLQVQKVMYLRQSINRLEESKTQNSFMSEDTS